MTDSNRIANSGVNDEEEEPSSEEAYRVPLARRRRRYYFFDNEAESEDELVNPQAEKEYIDYRTYPLLIDWKEVENDKSDAYDVYEMYGYFGIAIYTSLAKSKTYKIKTKTFLKSIVQFYVSNFEENTAAGQANIFDLISFLPKLSDIEKIIRQKLFAINELLAIKIILDLIEHFYSKYDLPFYTRFVESLIPVASMFYATLTEEDTKGLYEKFLHHKEIAEIMQKSLKSQVFKSSSEYLKHYLKLRSTKLRLIGGLTPKQFNLI